MWSVESEFRYTRRILWHIYRSMSTEEEGKRWWKRRVHDDDAPKVCSHNWKMIAMWTRPMNTIIFAWIQHTHTQTVGSPFSSDQTRHEYKLLPHTRRPSMELPSSTSSSPCTPIIYGEAEWEGLRARTMWVRWGRKNFTSTSHHITHNTARWRRELLMIWKFSPALWKKRQEIFCPHRREASDDDEATSEEHVKLSNSIVFN